MGQGRIVILRTFLYSALLMAIQTADLIQFPLKIYILGALYLLVLISSLWQHPSWNDAAGAVLLSVCALLAVFNLFHFLPLIQLIILVTVFIISFMRMEIELAGALLFAGVILSLSGYSLSLGSIHIDYSILGYGLVFFSFLFMEKKQDVLFIQIMIGLLLLFSLSGISVLYDLGQYMVYLGIVIILLFKKGEQKTRIPLLLYLLLSPLILISLILSQVMKGPWMELADISLILAKLIILVSLVLQNQNISKSAGISLSD